MGNHPTKQQIRDRPKKNVHWKSAEPPSPPGKPIIASPPDGSADVVALKWDRPQSDGGSPVIGYFIEHRRTGSPHWVRATPTLILQPELTLNGLEPGWRYQFRIIAANIVGPSEPSDLSDTLTVTLQRNAVATPHFSTEIIDQTVVENERVVFRVDVVGVPIPQINWFKDGFEVYSSRRTKIINENNVSTLIIHQAALTDEGEIKCSATNRAGHVVTQALLKVEAPPKIRLPRQYEDGLLVEADDVIRLKVTIAGRPTPLIVWSHNGEVIVTSNRYELMNTDKNSSLKITRAQRSDRGEYHLRASNKLGEDSVSFLLTVTAKPSPPGKVIISFSLGKSVTLSWTAPSDDGGCIIGNYIVEYFRIGWNVWLKAITTRQLTATLSDLIEGSEYRFRVKAESPYGVSDPSDESDVLFVPDPKRGIIKPETNKAEEIVKNIQPITTTVTQSLSSDKEQSKHIPIKQRNRKMSPSLKIDKSTGNDDPLSNDSILPVVQGKLSLDAFKNSQNSIGKISRNASPIYVNVKKSDSSKPIDNEKNTPTIDEAKNTQKTNYTLNAPHDDTDEIHTSNEFMLVLYDDDKRKIGGQRTAEQIIENSDIEDGNIPPPPPLSLSAPELGSALPESIMLRHCVSSTELLFEKAMQRVYQTIQNEERLRQNNKENLKLINQQSNQISPKPFINVENLSVDSGKVIEIKKFGQHETNYIDNNRMDCKTFNENDEDFYKNENEQYNIEYFEDEMEEDEEEEEEERDLKYEILQSQKLIGIYRPDMTPSNVEYADDYTDSTASSASSLDSLEKFIVTVKTVNNKDDEELETYHPHMGPNIELNNTFSNEKLSIVAGVDLKTVDSHTIHDVSIQNSSMSDSSDTGRELKSITSDSRINNNKPFESVRKDSLNLSPSPTGISENSDISTASRPISPYRQPSSDQSTIELNKPLPLPDPNFVPKPILKRPLSIDNNNEPVEKNKKSEKKGLMQLFGGKKSTSNSSLTSSQDKLKTQNGAKSDIVKKDVNLTSAQKARLAMIERRQSSIEENKVAIDHYSDIVRECTSADGGRKLYSPILQQSDINEIKDQLDQHIETIENCETEKIIKPNQIDEDTNKINKSNVSKARPNESYSRSIFSIKLSKEPKKAQQKEHLDLNVTADGNRIIETNVNITNEDNVKSMIDKDLKQNEEVTTFLPSLTDDKDPAPRSRSNVKVTKQKQIRNRSRSGSTVRTKPDSKQIQNDIETHLQSASKSPVTKTRITAKKTLKSSINSEEKQQYSQDELPNRCRTPDQILADETKTKVQSTMAYITDVAMFCVACWIYVFKDARWALPVLALMIYRQVVGVLKQKFPNWINLEK